MDDKIKEKLIYEAIFAMNNAYVPYSKFHVGAAVLTASGKIYKGTNVENASYPAGICAERVAIFSAVADGLVDNNNLIEAIAIVGGKELNGNIDINDYCPPCGICRQVIREFANPEKCLIILAKSPKDYKEYLLKDLLPESFGPNNLK